MENKYILNPNPLVKFLQKPQQEFTKADIIRYVTALCRRGRKVENLEFHHQQPGTLGQHPDLRRTGGRLKPFPLH